MIKLLNTRPSHQSHHLTQLIRQAGGTVFHLPLMEIEAIVFKPVNLGDVDIVIVTSANALQHGIYFNSPHHHNKIIAIGNATKKALEKYAHNILCPQHFSSEGILQMPELQEIQKKSIVIISGENPKPLLKNELISRGALVRQMFTYRRKVIFYNMEKILPEIEKAGINTIVVTSNDNFTHLVNLFCEKKYREWLLSKTICVVNTKMKNDARSIGFSAVIQAQDATDSAIAAVLYESYKPNVLGGM